MDINLIFTLIGILLAIVSLYLFFKSKAKSRLVYLKNFIISPITIIKNIPDIEILYKKSKSVDRIFLTNVTFINAGNIDIDKTALYQPLSIILPDGFNWLTSDIIEKSEKLNIETTRDENNLQFTWDLLKPKEFFTLEGLIEYKGENFPEDRKKLRKMSFDFRIKNINKIETLEKSRLLDTTTFIFFLFLSFVGLYLGYKLIEMNITQKNENKFYLELSDKSSFEIKGLKFNSEKNNVIIEDERNNDLDTLNNIDSTFNINVRVSSNKSGSSNVLLILGVFILIISFIGLIYNLKRYLYDLSIKKIFQSN